MGTGLIMALGLFLASFLTHLSYHVDRLAKITPVHRYKESFLSYTEYVDNLVSSRRTGTVSCSRTLVSVGNESCAFQLACSVIIPRHDLFMIPVDLKHNPNWLRNFLVADLLRVKRLLMSGYRRIAISSAELAWCTGLKPGVTFTCVFIGLPNTEEVFLESVGFTSSVSNLPVVIATFISSVRSSATDKIEDAVSRERSDMLGLLKI